jgi:hypothetical protein
MREEPVSRSVQFENIKSIAKSNKKSSHLSTLLSVAINAAVVCSAVYPKLCSIATASGSTAAAPPPPVGAGPA